MRRTWILLLVLSIFLAGCGETSEPYKGKSVDELVEMLQSDDVAKQNQGAYGLALLKEEARPAVPALLKAVDNPDSGVRQMVVMALGNAKSTDPKVVQALVRQLMLRKDQPFGVRRQAALSLGELGSVAKSAIPKLKEVQADETSDKLVRQAAGDALRKISR